MRPKTFDLRRRVGTLIKILQDIPTKHRTPALQRLLDDLQHAAAVYDGQQDDEQ